MSSVEIMPWGSVADLIKTGIDKIWPDPAEASKAKARLIQAQQAGELKELEYIWDNAKAQLEVNKAEASHTNLFVSGWRPAVGWVCATAFGWSFVLQPFATWGIFVFGWDVADVPTLDLSQLMPVLLGMLGLGAYRSFEKAKNVNHFHK